MLFLFACLHIASTQHDRFQCLSNASADGIISSSYFVRLHTLSLIISLGQVYAIVGSAEVWTHSAFGFDGQLKHLFHGKSDIVNQLLFNIDVSCTLQQVHPRCESERTMMYIDPLPPIAPVCARNFDNR